LKCHDYSSEKTQSIDSSTQEFVFTQIWF